MRIGVRLVGDSELTCERLFVSVRWSCDTLAAVQGGHHLSPHVSWDVLQLHEV